MKTFILVGLCLITLFTCSVKIDEDHILNAMEGKSTKELFKVYHFLFKKDYEINSDLGLQKYKAFKANSKLIKEVNSKNLSYKYGYNEFTDLSDEEFKALYTVDPKVFEEQYNKFLMDFDTEADKIDAAESDINPVLADTLDYSTQMNEPRHQGICGSCWAFSGLGSIEHALYRAGQDYSYLSPQHLVDCASTDVGVNEGGCFGGLPSSAAKFSIANGIYRDAVYPYFSGATKKNGTCQTLNADKVKIKSYQSFRSSSTTGSSTDLSTWLGHLNKGAMVVTVAAGPTKLSLYKSGVWVPDSTLCATADHGIVAVGYYYDNDNNLIIKLRNSWGITFGEAGYFYIKYDPSIHTCNITKTCVRPDF
jgi:C1A family cysteine protease